jgi:hypothetical protein
MLSLADGVKSGNSKPVHPNMVVVVVVVVVVLLVSQTLVPIQQHVGC